MLCGGSARLNYNTLKRLFWGGGGHCDLKGQCHEIFDFFMNQVPPSPRLSHKARFKFFEISQRYSQLTVHYRCRWHRWQIKKIFNLKFFFFNPLSSRVNIYCIWIYFFKFTLRCQQSACVPIICHWCNLLPVSLILVANCHRCHWHQRR